MIQDKSIDQVQRQKEYKLNDVKQQQLLPQDDRGLYLTAAYEDFKNRLCYKYLISYDSSDFKLLQQRLKMIPGNSSAQEICTMDCFQYLGAPLLLIPTIYWNSKVVFEVQSNHFALVINQSNEGQRTEIYGPGYHVLSYFNKLQGIYSFQDQYTNNIISSEIGDLQICRVNQGEIVSFESSGQNLILPPGIHKITDPLIYQNTISLDSFYIQIGPERWVTIPDGYDGISVNRGKINILEGGVQHHLSHVGEKFVKIIPKILQSDKITTDVHAYIQGLDKNIKYNYNKDDPAQYLQTTTIEGSFISLDAMIFWYITDTSKAVKNGMEILNEEEEYAHLNQKKAIQDAYKNIHHLRQTVLRIAKNHLCALVSTCSISQKIQKSDKDSNSHKEGENTFEILSILQHKDAYLKKLINTDLDLIGCQMQTICIYSVSPNKEIQIELDKQTKAKVDAKTSIIQVTNKQQTNLIEMELTNDMNTKRSQCQNNIIQMEAQAKANAKILTAKAEAESIVTIAQARKVEAQNLMSSEFAQELERIRVLGEAGQKVFQGESNNFVFGKNPADALYTMFQKKFEK